MNYRIMLILMALVNGIFLWGQNSVERKLEPFDQLIVDDQIIVRLVHADNESAVIKAQGVDMESVRTEITDGSLNIYVYGKPFAQKSVTVTLNFKNLHSIEAINGADISTASLFKTDSLFIDLKTGGMLYLDADIGYLNSRVIEGSLLTTEGYATVHDIYVATAATVSAFELESDTVTVRALTGGKAKIDAEEELDAQALSKGYVSYKGNPHISNITTRSGGTIEVYSE